MLGGVLTRTLVFNLLEVSHATLVVAADREAVDLEVEYLGGKTGIDGSRTVPPAPGGRLHVAARAAEKLPIDLTHAAFGGGYGAVRVRSVGDAQAPFAAFLGERNPHDTNPISGAAFEGRRFALPYVKPPASAPTQRVRVCVTNPELQPRRVDIQNVTPGGGGARVELGPLCTCLWDSESFEENVTGNGLVEVVGDGTVAVSALITRAGRDYHIYPLRLD